jgi:hypothetical protein
MLDKNIEQRVNIKFLMKFNKPDTETLNLLRETYGENALWRARVFEWCKRFSEGREAVEDERRGGQTTVKTDENVEKERTLVRTDCS